MGRYLIRRALFVVLVLFVVSLFTFLIFVKLPAADSARGADGKSTSIQNVRAARRALGSTSRSGSSTVASRRD